MSWYMGMLSGAPARPGSGVLGCLVLLGCDTARACCVVTRGVASWQRGPRGLVAHRQFVQVLSSCPMLNKKEDVHSGVYTMA